MHRHEKASARQNIIDNPGYRSRLKRSYTCCNSQQLHWLNVGSKQEYLLPLVCLVKPY